MGAPASEFHFYSDIFSQVDGALTSYVSDTASTVIGAISGVATTMFTIYVVMWGISMIRGLINEPITDGAIRMVRIAVVMGIALNIGLYNQFLADWLMQTPDRLGAIIASGSSDVSTNVDFLDTLFSKLYDLGNAFWQKANAAGGLIPDIGLILVAIGIWAVGIIATGYGAFLLVLAKTGLALVMALGPIFVLLTMFDATRKFFDSWISQVVKFVLMAVLTAAAIKLILKIIETYLTAHGAGIIEDPTIPQSLPAFALCAIAFLVMMQVSSIASGLAGGVAISTLGAAGWAYNKATGGIAAGRDIASGKALSDARAQRRAKALNARWAARNPGVTARAASAAASAPMAVYRRISGGRNSVSQG